MQSRVMSMFESVANVAVGLGVAFAAQLIVFPWFGILVPVQTNLAISAVFTVISLARSYALRRLFERTRGRR